MYFSFRLVAKFECDRFDMTVHRCYEVIEMMLEYTVEKIVTVILSVC